jgi:hypothetical protein
VAAARIRFEAMENNENEKDLASKMLDFLSLLAQRRHGQRPVCGDAGDEKQEALGYAMGIYELLLRR